MMNYDKNGENECPPKLSTQKLFSGEMYHICLNEGLGGCVTIFQEMFSFREIWNYIEIHLCRRGTIYYVHY